MNISGSARHQQLRYALVLIRQLVITDFKVKYQSSVLGYVWSLLRPLFLFSIMYVFFGIFIGTGSGIPHYSAYLLLGIVLWNFFSEVTLMGVSAVVGQSSMLRKLYFPKYVIILAVAVTATINLLLNLVVVGVFMLAGGADLRAESLLAIPMIIELGILAVGLSFLLSALYVKFHDTGYVWEIILQAGFYATPIIYPLRVVYDKSHLVSQLLVSNPVAQVIQDCRFLLITRQTMTTGDLFVTSWARLIPVAITVLFAAGSVWYFKRQAPNFAEMV